jgi:hypothetical protein
VLLGQQLRPRSTAHCFARPAARGQRAGLFGACSCNGGCRGAAGRRPPLAPTTGAHRAACNAPPPTHTPHPPLAPRPPAGKASACSSTALGPSAGCWSTLPAAASRTAASSPWPATSPAPRPSRCPAPPAPRAAADRGVPRSTRSHDRRCQPVQP